MSSHRNASMQRFAAATRTGGRVLAILVASLAQLYVLHAQPSRAQSTSGEQAAFPLPAHLDQHDLPALDIGPVVGAGGRLFRAEFNRLDGVGSNLSGDAHGSVRFSRVPRMDLPGYAGNPLRATGPNAQGCTGCHHVPFAGGAGALVDLEIRDPLRGGNPAMFIQRNPLHLFGNGALQLLAEQTTRELGALRSAALADARASNQPVSVELITSNGVSYGRLRAFPDGQLDTSAVAGIDPDLIVKPYSWKGRFVTFLRPLIGLGAEVELGMGPAELYGEHTDFDGDGVRHELSIGDVTAMTVWVASLPRPVSQLELSEHLAGAYRLSSTQKASIRRGRDLFASLGCAACHIPALNLADPVFREPSPLPEHRFPLLPSGQNPLEAGLDPARPVAVDLAVNPQIGPDSNDADCRARQDEDAKSTLCFLQYEVSGRGIIVRLYGDLKRHDMGPGLAENIDEAGSGASVWKTRELWGVGNTGPWLHDGRATTLDEAIRWHGGEAQQARDRYAGLALADQHHLVRFLQNLVLFDPRSVRDANDAE